MTKQHRKLSSEKLAYQWNLSNGSSASPRLVRKILQEHDMLWRPACLKPRLADRHNKKQCLEFCNQYKNWSKYGWRDVLFSDEMNIEVDSRKCKVMLRRTANEKCNKYCIINRTKQGSGSIGIWACMSYDGVKFFKLFNGRLNSEAYQEILENYLILSTDLNG